VAPKGRANLTLLWALPEHYIVINNFSLHCLSAGSLNTPPPSKRAKASLAVTREKSVNLSLLTIDKQLKAAELMLPAKMSQFIGIANPPTSEPAPAPLVDVAQEDWPGTSNLGEHFDPTQCHIPSAEYLRKFNPRVSILTEDKEHIMHCAPVEFYLADNLHKREHTFDTMMPLSNPQLGTCLHINYPQAMDHFSEDVSVIKGRGTSGLFDKHLGGVRMCLPKLMQFVLEFGECNEK